MIRKTKKRSSGGSAVRQELPNSTPAPCSSLPAVYLIATPSFCLLSSLPLCLAIPPSSPLHPLLIHVLPEQMGDCKARWPIQAVQSVSACCTSIRWGGGKEKNKKGGPECFQLDSSHMWSFSLCYRKIKISGTAWTESMSTEADRESQGE